MSEPFLKVYDMNLNILLFLNITNLTYLSKVEVIYVNGTFQSSETTFPIFFFIFIQKKYLCFICLLLSNKLKSLYKNSLFF